MSLAVVAAALAVSDLCDQLSGGSLVVGGVSDEIAHECTGILVLWALGRRATRRLLVGVLVGSVVIDLDHVPAYLGFNGLTAATPRPYTHALLTIAVLAAATVLVRSRRDFLLGLTLGTAIHLWRDLSESGAGVSLLWPFSDHSFTFPHAGYVAIMAAVVALDACVCWVVKAKPPNGPPPTEQCQSAAVG